jgi:hypothetical protein
VISVLPAQAQVAAVAGVPQRGEWGVLLLLSLVLALCAPQALERTFSEAPADFRMRQAARHLPMPEMQSRQSSR